MTTSFFEIVTPAFVPYRKPRSLIVSSTDGDRVRAVLVDEVGDEVAELLLRERAVEEVVVRRVLAVELADRLAQRAVDLRVEDHAARRW